MESIMIKRDRSVNFTRAEVEILTDTVCRFRHIVENKKTDSTTNKEKEEAWQNITESFNAVSGVTARSAKTLKLKYDGVKKEIKKKASQNRQELYRTGGGGPAAVTFTDVEEKVLGICSNITGLDARFDNDLIQGPELPVILDEIEIVTTKAPYDNIQIIAEEDAKLESDARMQSLEIGSGEDAGVAEGKPDTKWQTWTPRSLKSKVSPLLRPKVTKGNVTARIDDLTTARLELVKIQIEIAQNELKNKDILAKKELAYKEIEHKLRITHMLNEEERKKEAHEMKINLMLYK